MKRSIMLSGFVLALATFQSAVAADPGVTALASINSATNDDQRFEARYMELQTARNQEQMVAFERDARQLMKEFPKRPEPYLMLFSVSQQFPAERRRAMLEELSKSPDLPEEVKGRLDGALRQLNVVGHPLDLHFTALDGREVDLAKLKGKVVMVDFWATWCGPCVQEVPNVKRAYENLHGQGFEIVGISLDKDKDALEKFVKTREMPWPQYFDGKGWENKYAQYCGVNRIPAMWLVDREGKVVDTDGRENLENKVKSLLAGK